MNYADYLKLDQLLSIQQPESDRLGRPARDELLFIIVHQAYELWFKQILNELNVADQAFTEDHVDDADIGKVVHALDRIAVVLRVLVNQIDILETMTPLDFLEFRDLLIPASGFQSAQFRQIEVRLGLMPEARISFNGQSYKSKLRATDQRVLSKLESQSSLADRVEAWLLRTPFVVWKDWDFEDAYSRAVETMFANERHMISENPELDQEQRERQLRNVEQSEDAFRSILQPVDGTVAAPGWRFRPQALLAALFINLYRDEPALQLPYRLLTALMDIDELLSTWRHRHALMVQRMIGRKIGTGGSSGHDYLKSSAEKHRIFGDLFALATFLIPRSALPPLPPHVQRAMRYQYTDTAS